jgi:hypothetical protein
MTMLRELAAELIGMFLGDRGLALALLAVIGVAALASGVGEAGSIVAAALLALGCPLLLIENVIRAGRRRGRQSGRSRRGIGSASEAL